MAKSKHRKKHKKKIAARKQKIQSQKNKMKKFQDDFYQQIMKEKENGAFDKENLKDLPLSPSVLEDNSSEYVSEDNKEDNVIEES